MIHPNRRVAPWLLSLLSLPAGAGPLPALGPGVLEEGAYVERLAEPVTAEVDPDVYDALLEAAAGRAPVGAISVELRAVDGTGTERPLRELLRRRTALPEPEPGLPEGALPLVPVDAPGDSSGALSGRAVYLSQCHGQIWFDSLGRFSTQRGVLFETVEDLHNPEGADQYLARYLENAGAAVFTTKERDIRAEMSIADNDGTGYSESGAGFADGQPGFADTSPYPYGDNPFDAGTTRTFPANGGGVATWQPDVPTDGHYAVYVSWDADLAHAPDAHYRITHPGGTLDRRFDQRAHGSTWQYVETLWLEAGSPLTVELVGDSASSALLSADAVRIGGGMEDVQRHGVTSGRPRWEGGAIQYVQFNGAPSSVYDPYGDGTTSDGGSDPSARSAWAAWEHPAGEDAVYLSWHSNAATGTARGTITYYGGDCSPVPGSYDLAASVQDELMSSITARWDPAWTDRGVGSACFSEVSSALNDEMPSVLVELAFHDNVDDAAHLKEPTFRDDAARAMYRGIVRYFAERDGAAPVFLPEPPAAPSLVHGPSGELVASWSPGPSGAPLGDPADDYLLYRSADGRAWDAGTPVSGTSATVAADPGETVFVRVAGRNAGGLSFPSAVVGARRSPSGRAPILIVDAFDRLDSGQLDHESVPGVGTVVRMDLDRLNPGDTVAVHGEAIALAGWPFDSIADERTGELDLSDYDLVVWAAGEESTAEESFDDDQQALVRDYVEGGGALWVSGAEILWDLDARGSDTDRAFAEEVLGALLASDAATTDLVDGEGALAGVGPMDFGADAGAPYPVEWPDVLDSTRPVVARYGDGTVAGVLGDGVALLGFPFECIGSPTSRAEVASALIAALLPGLDPPTTSTTTIPPTGTDTGTPGDTGGTEPTDGAPDPGEPPSLPGPTTAPDRGCGCASSPIGGASGWGIGLAVSMLRRRRPGRVGGADPRGRIRERRRSGCGC